jgi:hypothetical protein
VGDRHDFPGLVDEPVPGVAAVVDDVVIGFEHVVGEPVRPHELPEVFLGIELRRARRQYVVWRIEVFGAMPSGLIENKNGVSVAISSR